jgi:hypothetical protein
MIWQRSYAVISLALLIGRGSALHAQQGTRTDVRLAFGFGFGVAPKPRYEHGGLVVDALASRRSERGWTYGIGGAMDGYGPVGDSCRITRLGGPCLGQLRFRLLAALGGRALTTRAVELALRIGPSLVSSTDGPETGGLQVRADVVGTSADRIAALVAVRHTWLPNYQGASYSVFAGVVGFRIRLW